MTTKGTLTTGTDEAAVRGLTNAVLPFLDPEIDFDAEDFLETLRADPAAARAVRDAIDPDGLRALIAQLIADLDRRRTEALDPPDKTDWTAFAAESITLRDAALAIAERRLLEGTPDAD